MRLRYLSILLTAISCVVLTAGAKSAKAQPPDEACMARMCLESPHGPGVGPGCERLLQETRERLVRGEGLPACGDQAEPDFESEWYRYASRGLRLAGRMRDAAEEEVVAVEPVEQRSEPEEIEIYDVVTICPETVAVQDGLLSRRMREAFGECGIQEVVWEITDGDFMLDWNVGMALISVGAGGVETMIGWFEERFPISIVQSDLGDRLVVRRREDP